MIASSSSAEAGAVIGPIGLMMLIAAALALVGCIRWHQSAKTRRLRQRPSSTPESREQRRSRNLRPLE